MDFRDIKEFFKDMFGYVIVILIVLVIVLYVVTLQQVIGPSMEPTLNEGDVLILNKFHYYLFDVKRNDVISFKHDGSKYLIKRVIGLPGESVYYKDNMLYINGNPYKENIVDGLVTEDFNLEDLGYDVIPENMYLVLGDNRDNSLDSRSKEVGLIKKEDIIGKVFIRIWPLNGFKLVK